MESTRLSVLLPAWLLLTLPGALSACSSKWSAQDADGDGYSIIDGDCWDNPVGPEGTGLTGADIHPGATETWYDGYDQDCGDQDDFDADADGFVPDEHVGVATYGVSGTGDKEGGDCWDDPDNLPEGWSQVASTAPVTAAQTSPAAVDSWYDGIDQDCGGNGDFDADLDGHDSADHAQGDGSIGDDCDDADADINPGATEVCDDIDNDCDALIDSADDDVDPTSTRTWYGDGDGDGYGDDDQVLEACDQPDGYVSREGDCQDDDETINPGADELCNDVDDDCNGAIDEAASDAPTWFGDDDGDGYGTEVDAVAACDRPDGYVDNSDDCDDDDDQINPAADERCSTVGVDDDCDGTADEDDAVDVSTWYSDLDGDGYGLASLSTDACEEPVAFSAIAGDCDDGDYDINPGVDELCSTVGVDDDCDGLVDDEDVAADFDTWYRDADGDGRGDPTDSTGACSQPDGYVDNTDDCDDGCDACWTDAEEICNDYVDNDCDGTGNDCTMDEDIDLADVAIRIAGEASDDAAALDVAAGDVDQDGQIDLIIGAAGAGDSGAAYLVLGPIDDATDVSAADLVITGATAGDKAGRAVALTDIDGDGYDDVIVTATSASPSGAGRGGAYVIYGPASGSLDLGSADWNIRGAGDYDYLGREASGLGDVDADGVADFGIGGILVDYAQDKDGAVMVFTGADTGTDTSESIAAAVLYGSTSNDRLSSGFDAAGDVDGDGVDDVIAGALRDDAAGADAGAAFLFLGPLAGDIASDDADAIWTGETAGDYAGGAVAGGGDVDGDGRPDLLVGAARQSTSTYGAAYLVLGSSSPTGGSLGDAAVVVRGTVAEQYVGVSVELIGDLDGDGLIDMAVGEGERDDCSSASAAGAVYVFYSGAAGSLTSADADVHVRGSDTGDCAGGRVLGPGDVTGDGYLDLVIGAPGDDSRTGAAYVVPGVGM